MPTNTQEGHIRLDQNVGVDIDNAREGAIRQDQNVGVDIDNAREGYARQDQNVGVDNPNAREGYLRTEFGDVSTNTPTPHAWYLRPDFGREGHEFKVVGHGFGATQLAHPDARVRLNDLECGVIDWQKIDGTADALGPDRRISKSEDRADPEHEEIRVTVPPDAVSGLVRVEHNDT